MISCIQKIKIYMTLVKIVKTDGYIVCLTRWDSKQKVIAAAAAIGCRLMTFIFLVHSSIYIEISKKHYKINCTQ